MLCVNCMCVSTLILLSYHLSYFTTQVEYGKALIMWDEIRYQCTVLSLLYIISLKHYCALRRIGGNFGEMATLFPSSLIIILCETLFIPPTLSQHLSRFKGFNTIITSCLHSEECLWKKIFHICLSVSFHN